MFYSKEMGDEFIYYIYACMYAYLYVHMYVYVYVYELDRALPSNGILQCVGGCVCVCVSMS